MPAATKPAMGRNLAPEWRQAFGNIVRGIRLQRDMTQRELAVLMGIAPTMLSGIETGAQSFPPERLQQFIQIADLEPEQFARTYLRYSNPWAYLAAGLATNDSKAIKAELEQVTQKINQRRGPRA